MILEELKIELMKYGDSKGKHLGYVSFVNESGKVSLTLTPEKCEQIFSVCADGLIETAKEAAESMTCNIIDHQKKLES